MTVKEALHDLIDQLSEEEAAELLDFLAPDDEGLSEDDVIEVNEARRAYRKGEFVTLDDWKADNGL